MPRKDLKAKDKRGLPGPDPVFKSALMAQFTNKVLEQGKKSLAERILFKMMDVIKQKSNEDPLVVFNRAMDNVRPLLEVKARRGGGTIAPGFLSRGDGD
jgi:small subunit ribosomal protein S7